MTVAPRWQPRHRALASHWRWPARARRALRIALIGLCCGLAGWVALPFLGLWRLERALAAGPQALAPLVDLAAVRDQLFRRLDKTQPSPIGELSDPFVDWLATTLRGGGAARLDQAVTLDWVHGLLRERSGAGGALWSVTQSAWFDRPARFRVRLGRPGPPSLQLIWRPGLTGWRIVAVYY